MITNTREDPSYLVVIPITDNIDTLEDAWNRYNELPIELMQDSDDLCIQKYGITNQQLYQKLKHRIDQIEDLESFTEGFELPVGADDTFLSDDTFEIPSEELIAKIKLAQSLESDTVVIIYPYTDTYPYTLDDLEELFSRYNLLSWDLQQMSDQESLKLFNYDVRNMYFKNKNKLITKLDNENQLDESTNIDTVYFNSVKKMCNESTDLTALLKKKLDLINLKQNGNLLESTYAEDSIGDIDAAIELNKDIADAVPEFTPFLTPLELDDMIQIGSLSEDELKTYKSIKASASNGYKGFDSKSYRAKLEAVQNSGEPYNVIEQKFINLGWNPNLAVKESTLKFARKRQINFLKEYYHINIVDLTKESVVSEGQMYDLSTTLTPIFLVVGLDVCYLSTDPELRFLFDDSKDTISFNLIMKDTDIDVYCLFVDKSTYGEVVKHIKDARYNTELFNALRSSIPDKKHLCSVFVDIVSAMANMDRTNDPKVYHIFSGQKMYFTADKIEPIIHAILSDSVGFVTRKYSTSDAVKKMFSEPSSALYRVIKCNEAEIEANEVLDELRYLYTADSVLVEAKAIPIRMNNKGLYIDLPTHIEEQYQTIHKSLLVYEKEKNYEEMKSAVAHLWYLNLLTERKINKYKGKDNKASKIKVSRDLRARILNDFKKYLAMIIAYDKDFDFDAYFKKSPYNDRTLFVNKDTMIYFTKILRAIVQSIIKR